MEGEVNEMQSGSLSDHNLGTSCHITNLPQLGASTRLLTPYSIPCLGSGH